jgi:cardiolipin synthase
VSTAAVIAELVTRLSPEYCHRLMTLLSEHEAIDDISHAAIDRIMRNEAAASAAANALDRIRREYGFRSSISLAVAIEASLLVARRSDRNNEIDVVWTGPAANGAPSRRSAAVLLELINSAMRELLVLSFASFQFPNAMEAFEAAARRGVALHFVLESPEESGGRLRSTGEPIAHDHALANARFYVWPKEQRPHGAVMHAKALVVDRRRVLVTSANLTEYAIDSNIELGLLLDNVNVGELIATHVFSLVTSSVLRRA